MNKYLDKFAWKNVEKAQIININHDDNFIIIFF